MDTLETIKNRSNIVNLGNFVNRALTFVMKFYDGKIPEAQINGTMRTWVSEVNDRLAEYNLNLAENKQRDALRNILAISRLGNQLIQIWQPWVKVKKPETKQEADACVMLAGAALKSFTHVT